jgi:hypothetical protein
MHPVSADTVATVASSISVVLTFVGAVTVKAFKAFSRLERALAVVDVRSQQLEANGGSSLFDGFRRLETKVDQLVNDVINVRERVAVVESVASKAANEAVNLRSSVDGIASQMPRRSTDAPPTS